MATRIAPNGTRQGCRPPVTTLAGCSRLRQPSIVYNLRLGPRTKPSRQIDNEDIGRGGGPRMLWTLFIVLLVFWLIGVVSAYTLGGFIHLLLVLAVVALIFQLLTDHSGSMA
jgi:hypothetical protein